MIENKLYMHTLEEERENLLTFIKIQARPNLMNGIDMHYEHVL